MEPATTLVGREAVLELLDLASERVRCPYPAWAALREHEPVTWFDELGAFVVTSYDLIVEMLRQPERFSSQYISGPTTDRQIMAMIPELMAEDPEIRQLIERRASVPTNRVLVQADPPEHSRQRALVNRAFSPSVVRSLEPGIEALAHSLIDGFIDAGRIEVVNDYATPIPMTVIANALGVSHDRMDDFKRWSDGVVITFGKTALSKQDVSETVRASAELQEYLAEVIASREIDPGPDLISRIVESRIDGDRLTPGEVGEMVSQFLIAGNETTAKLITGAILRLTQEPKLAEQLRREPTLIPSLVEEMLRVEPPAGGLYRMAVSDYVLGGVPIPAGSHVLMVFAAGNHDPEHFAEPDTCVLGRTEKSPHLAFGLGPHFCVGAGLARAEAKIAIDVLLRRCTDLRLEVDADAIVYEPSYMVHGITKLPITFTPIDR